MRSLADRVPPEIARQIHPDRRKNEAAYWATRDQLLGQTGSGPITAEISGQAAPGLQSLSD